MQPSADFAHKLFCGECTFIAGATNADALPKLSLAEVAFIGRSNVGKSSLINALTNRKTIARVSITPGRTKQLNFFLLANRLILVDLPGYGYAKAPKKEVASWNGLIRNYLRGRVNLQRVCVLIDGRRGILEVDVEMMKLLDEAAVSYQLVLTKADKLTEEELQTVMESMQKAIRKHPAALTQILITSSEKKTGLEELRAALAEFAV